MSVHLPPFVGCLVQPNMTLSQRVHWYELWIKAYPCTTIHFKYPHLGDNAGFMCESSWQRT
jgi:hypothetical protein